MPVFCSIGSDDDEREPWRLRGLQMHDRRRPLQRGAEVGCEGCCRSIAPCIALHQSRFRLRVDKGVLG
jgi:hypothetical protein